ncbi:MAG: glycosyltransferase family 2 protein [Peptococcaceae bacterium]
MSKTVVFGGGFYASPMAESELQPVKIAAVICTYKREDYVQRNLRHLRETVLAQPQAEIARHLEVFVVDNGQTLQRDEVESPGIRLFPNKNLGGSGGFTRGIIEALRRREEFNHVLLMDDDILLESSVLVKTIRFLQIVRSEHQDLAIGGSMLRLDDMAVQHEAGGKWTGRKIINLNKGFDLCNVSDLLKNEIDNRPDYNAWWYACLPLCLIDENNLPLPLFVREDDVEYGFRLFRKWLLLNGVGVWHPSFDKKNNPIMEYYNTRNQLILNAIHYPNNPIYKNLYILLRFSGKCLLKHNGQMIQIPFKGFEDYLKGPVWLKQQDSLRLHQALVSYQKELETKGKKTLLFYWVMAGIWFGKSCIRLLLQYPKVVEQYQSQLKVLTSIDFWCEKLEIEH